MKRFLTRILTFSLFPLLLYCAVEVLLPYNFFTYRCWEALSIQTCNNYFYGSWYPDVELKMVEVGDLAHHTKFQEKKEVFWKTDKIGFRNDEFVADPDILFIGDSFISGSGLNQDETLPNLVKLISHQKVYQVATVDFSTFISLLNNKVISKPKTVVFCSVERNLPILEKVIKVAPQGGLVNSLRSSSFFNHFFTVVDRILKGNSIRYLKARVHNSAGLGKQSPVNPRMFFVEGPTAALNTADTVIRNTASTIINYKQYCDSVGINFIFLPCPNKETIYFEDVPFQVQPTFLMKLDTVLNLHNVKTINTLNILNTKRNSQLLYHYDDSHWNASATRIVAAAIMPAIYPGRNEKKATGVQ